jgi:hypothetical protein
MSVAKKKKAHKKKSTHTKTKRWSGRVTRESHALRLKHGVFTLKDPEKIAASLKRSAERSKERKAGPYRSALSMLTFYINRAGKNLPADRRKNVECRQGRIEEAFR